MVNSIRLVLNVVVIEKAFFKRFFVANVRDFYWVICDKLAQKRI